MVSVFLVNDAPIGIPNPSTAEAEINGVTSEAERSSSGDLSTLNKVNSIAKLVVSWDSLTIEQAEQLCQLFGIDVSPYGQPYEPKTIDQLAFKITTRLPSGLRSFAAYVGDTLSASLVDYSGQGDQSSIGGQYWESVRLSLIGLGEQWNV